MSTSSFELFPIEMLKTGLNATLNFELLNASNSNKKQFVTSHSLTDLKFLLK